MYPMNREYGPQSPLEGIIVTIDGPAGSGKSTTASILAERLGLVYLDTGAMYRGVTYAVLERDIDPENEASVVSVAESMELEFRTVDAGTALYADGVDISEEIRSPEVSRFVSPVSRYQGVRRAMVRTQRSIARNGGVVAEGRDTGSVVFPYAHVKVFLVADIDSRAERRRRQLQDMGMEQTLEEIRDNIVRRDDIDSGRTHSPLLKPAGALLVDTSSLTIEQQVDLIEEAVARETERLANLRVGGGKSNEFASMRFLYRISHAAVRIFWRILFGLRIMGAENLGYRECSVFASNHLSYADPLVAGCGLDREVAFVAKKELFRNRLFGWLIRTYNAIPIDRDEIDRAALKRISSELASGKSILMFPEGTRSRDGSIGELKAGLGFIALHNGAAVVPMHVSGTNDLYGCFLRKRRLEVRIGPPIRMPEGYRPRDRKNEYRILSAMVREEMRMLKNESEA
jgi:cytidylate kinase